MNISIHQPQRAADESRADYIARRKASRKASRVAVKAMTLQGIGNQRKAPSQRERLRDGQRANGNGPKGTYGTSLMAHYARKIVAASAAKLQRRALA